MVSALVYSAPFRLEVFLAFMNIRLVKFHEASVNLAVYPASQPLNSWIRSLDFRLGSMI